MTCWPLLGGVGFGDQGFQVSGALGLRFRRFWGLGFRVLCLGVLS